jgi:hypothetical protein
MGDPVLDRLAALRAARAAHEHEPLTDHRLTEMIEQTERSTPRWKKNGTTPRGGVTTGEGTLMA